MRNSNIRNVLVDVGTMEDRCDAYPKDQISALYFRQGKPQIVNPQLEEEIQSIVKFVVVDENSNFAEHL